MNEIKTKNEVFNAFGFTGVTEAVRYGDGHINDTFKVTCDQGQYILQRINTNIFKKPDEVMSNIVNVTTFLKEIVKKEGGDPQRNVLTVIKTVDGKNFFTDSDNGAWRCYIFIQDTLSVLVVTNDKELYSCAKSFGRFLKNLDGYDASKLFETIPSFHDTRNRFKNFVKALEEDKFKRASDIQSDIDFVLARKADCFHIMDKIDSGAMPLRVTHNDTKLNNILLDKETLEEVSIIDLDTIMPGSFLNDFGDSIRSGATTAAEDEVDLSKVHFDLNLFEVYTKGYLEECKDVLTADEISDIPWGAKLMTFECGMRFLTDYLEGDTYFKIHRDKHNLDRARNQFKLVSDMENCWEEMNAIVKKYV
ncbi:MAG: aminoglycoside phosphotransferase family protein [Clostridia bacterium]